MVSYSRRTLIALASAGAGVAIAGFGTPAHADNERLAACGSIPSTADPNVIKVVYEGRYGPRGVRTRDAGRIRGRLGRVPHEQPALR